jgi:nucleoside-diphosphate-sugar epimerase
VVALVGYSVGHRPVPRPLAYAAAYAIEAVWRAGRLRSEPPITRYLLDLISQDHWFDISAARRDLGYEPRVRLEEGLARMRESLQRAGL